jgi:hypothetical protein
VAISQFGLLAAANGMLANENPPPFGSRVPLPYKQGRFKSGEDDAGTRLQKLSPGEVWYGNSDEKPHPVMPTRPAAARIYTSGVSVAEQAISESGCVLAYRSVSSAIKVSTSFLTGTIS